MSESSTRNSPLPRGRPRHRAFWHGLLFLLPVVLLAGIGLWGLRSQKDAALEDARQRAEALCDRIVRDFAVAYREFLSQPHTEVTKEGRNAFLYPLAPEPPKDPAPSIAYEAAGDDEEQLHALLADFPDGRLASGLPLAPLVHYRLALGKPTDPQRVAAFVQSAVQDAPSIITPRLLDDLEKQGATLSDARAIWDRDERVRGSLRRHGEDILSRFFEGDGSSTPLFSGGREYWWPEFSDDQSTIQFIPLPELRSTARGLLAELDLPEFLTFRISLSLHTLARRPAGEPASISDPVTEEGLRETNTPALAEIRRGQIRASASIADATALFRTYRRQRAWFIGLIAAASLAALAGFVATRRTLREQERLNARMSNFVSSVSHELRAPVAAIRLLAERLREGRVDDAEKQREYFGFIDQESRRLTALIGNVLDFSRIEQGRKSYEFIETDLVELVRNTVSLMQPLAEEKSIRLLVETTPLPADPVLDGGAVQQALVNLLDNAIKFSPEGSAVTVTLAPSPESDAFLDLAVADEGLGIPAAEQARVFERFYRVGSELRRESKGVGIGLSIVRHLAEAHGGKVTVASDGTRGSTFTLHLPLAHG